MKLTKEDIDKVRHIEGFPIAKDEDIIALSNPPYYTALRFSAVSPARILMSPVVNLCTLKAYIICNAKGL